MKVQQSKLRLLLGVSLLATALGLPLQSLVSSGIAAPAAAPSSNALAVGKAAFQQKNYVKAAEHFQTVVQKEPTNCVGRLYLGKSFCKIAATHKAGTQQHTANLKKAAVELRKAIRLGKGNSHSVEANALLLTLPKNITAPKMGADTPMIAMANGIRGMDRGIGDGPKPKILEFYASWCEPCKQLKPFMEKAKTDYAEKVEFISYNVDDPATERIIEDYEVSPVPTLIFLDNNNQVVSYAIGYSGDSGLKQGMKKILPTK